MTDMTLTDMTPFFERHERRTRRVFVAMLSASLVVSAVIFTYGAPTTGAPGAILAGLWVPIVLYPLQVVAFWIIVALYMRKRPSPPGGRVLLNADDARNAARVANAGFVFVSGMGAILIASQAGVALQFFRVYQSLNIDGEWLGRAILVATGALMIYFGNVSPRMPTPRAPEQKPATRMKYNRLGGWLSVIGGLLLGLAALFLPIPVMIPAIAVLSISLLLVAAAGAVMFRIALNSRSTT